MSDEAPASKESQTWQKSISASGLVHKQLHFDVDEHGLVHIEIHMLERMLKDLKWRRVL